MKIKKMIYYICWVIFISSLSGFVVGMPLAVDKFKTSYLDTSCAGNLIPDINPHIIFIEIGFLIVMYFSGLYIYNHMNDED